MEEVAAGQSPRTSVRPLIASAATYVYPFQHPYGMQCVVYLFGSDGAYAMGCRVDFEHTSSAEAIANVWDERKWNHWVVWAD